MERTVFISELESHISEKRKFIQVVAGKRPSAKAFSIAGQLGWINLIYEAVEEAIILPLFYFIGHCLTVPKIVS